MAIFKELCLGSIDINEREKLCDKIQNQVTSIAGKLDDHRKKILHHYMNNMILGYKAMVIDIPKKMGRDHKFKSEKISKFTTCDIHRIIYGVVRLFESGTEEEKELFFSRLETLYTDEIYDSIRAIFDALMLVHDQK